MWVVSLKPLGRHDSLGSKHGKPEHHGHDVGFSGHDEINLLAFLVPPSFSDKIIDLSRFLVVKLSTRVTLRCQIVAAFTRTEVSSFWRTLRLLVCKDRVGLTSCSVLQSTSL